MVSWYRSVSKGSFNFISHTPLIGIGCAPLLLSATFIVAIVAVVVIAADAVAALCSV